MNHFFTNDLKPLMIEDCGNSVTSRFIDLGWRGARTTAPLVGLAISLPSLTPQPSSTILAWTTSAIISHDHVKSQRVMRHWATQRVLQQAEDSFVSYSKRLGNNQAVRRPIAHIAGETQRAAVLDDAAKCRVARYCSTLVDDINKNQKQPKKPKKWKPKLANLQRFRVRSWLAVPQVYCRWLLGDCWYCNDWRGITWSNTIRQVAQIITSSTGALPEGDPNHLRMGCFVLRNWSVTITVTSQKVR